MAVGASDGGAGPRLPQEEPCLGGCPPGAVPRGRNQTGSLQWTLLNARPQGRTGWMDVPGIFTPRPVVMKRDHQAAVGHGPGHPVYHKGNGGALPPPMEPSLGLDPNQWVWVRVPLTSQPPILALCSTGPSRESALHAPPRPPEASMRPGPSRGIPPRRPRACRGNLSPGPDTDLSQTLSAAKRFGNSS